MEIPKAICEGPGCGAELPPPQRSGPRRRRYCSDECRRRAARERAAALVEKRCGACGRTRPIVDFHAPHRGYCRECERAKQRARYREGRPYLGRERSYEKNVRRRHGIAPDEYEAMHRAQGGRCAVCGAAPQDRLHVDRDRAAGAVRELLCGPCGSGIAGARDDVSVLRAMISYLERHGAGA